MRETSIELEQMLMNKSLSSVIIEFIYAIIYIIAFAQLKYQLRFTSKWETVYKYSVYLLIFLCFLYFLVKRRIEINRWEFLLLFFVLYETLVTLILNGIINPGTFIRDIYAWPLLAFVFCDYSKRNALPCALKPITYVGMTMLYITCIPNIIEHLTGDGRNGAVVGPVYYLFGLLPVILVLCNFRTAIFFSILTFIFLVISTKRAGTLIVIFGMMLVYYLYGYMKGEKQRLKKSFRRIVVIVMALAGLFVIMKAYNITLLQRFLQIQQDEGSGRVGIWKTVIREFVNSTTIKQIMGHGFHSVAYDLVLLPGRSIFAHNSFLEILYDYGIIGLLILLMIMLYLVIRIVFLAKRKDYRVLGLGFSFSIIIILGSLGYFFEEAGIILPVSIAWGVSMGDRDTYKYKMK